MTVTVDVQFATESMNPPSEQALTHWVTAAFQESQKNSTETDSAEVSIRIVDDSESQALNLQYRGKDKPTNVLSFPAEFPEGVDIAFLGDLVICAPVVAQEAAEQQKPLEAHWAHMVIHGTLHLLGYDHIDAEEAEIMEALETKLVQSLGHPCPYSLPYEPAESDW